MANEVLHHRGHNGFLFETFLYNQLADRKYGPKRSRIIADFVLFAAVRKKNRKLVSWTITHFGNLLTLSKLTIQDRNYISLVLSNGIDQGIAE
jgi:hypothetical protein